MNGFVIFDHGGMPVMFGKGVASTSSSDFDSIEAVSQLVGFAFSLALNAAEASPSDPAVAAPAVTTLTTARAFVAIVTVPQQQQQQRQSLLCSFAACDVAGCEQHVTDVTVVLAQEYAAICGVGTKAPKKKDVAARWMRLLAQRISDRQRGLHVVASLSPAGSSSLQKIAVLVCDGNPCTLHVVKRSDDENEEDADALQDARIAFAIAAADMFAGGGGDSVLVREDAVSGNRSVAWSVGGAAGVTCAAVDGVGTSSHGAVRDALCGDRSLRALAIVAGAVARSCGSTSIALA